MRKAFTFIEMMIVICMIAIISAIAIPNILKHRESEKITGKTMVVKSSGQKVEVLRRVISGKETTNLYSCRIDNGPEVTPRYQQIEFHVDELVPLEPTVEK